MIKQSISDKIAADIESIMIKADDVANVIAEHSLVNSLIVLSNEKYSLIPVLSSKSELVGLINMQCIIEACTTDESINLQLLEDKKVKDIQLIKAGVVSLDDSIEFVLFKLIDHNFVCVTDENNIFLGIVTRRNLLKQVCQFLHSL